MFEFTISTFLALPTYDFKAFAAGGAKLKVVNANNQRVLAEINA